MTHAMHHM